MSNIPNIPTERISSKNMRQVIRRLNSNPAFEPSGHFNELQTPLNENPLLAPNTAPNVHDNNSDNELNDPKSRFYANSKKRLNAEAKAKAEANAKAKNKANYNSTLAELFKQLNPNETNRSYFDFIAAHPEYEKYDIMIQSGILRPQIKRIMEEEEVDPDAMKIIAEQAMPSPPLPTGSRPNVRATLSRVMKKFNEEKEKQSKKGGKRSTRKTQRKTHRKLRKH